LQCVLAANILTVYFVVCTLAVKKNQGRFRHVGSDHSLVRFELGTYRIPKTSVPAAHACLAICITSWSKTVCNVTFRVWAVCENLTFISRNVGTVRLELSIVVVAVLEFWRTGRSPDYLLRMCRY
jgi:hypothetical protein